MEITVESSLYKPWLALVIGNSRLHWGFFDQEVLQASWHTPHLSQSQVDNLEASGFHGDQWAQIIPESADEVKDALALLPQQGTAPLELWIASVVPAQTYLWTIGNPISGAISSEQASQVQLIERSHIPLAGLYDTLGSDRAITLLGAGTTLGWPVLVIDSGTALTFTAGVLAQSTATVYGGAIFPGIRLQAQSLAQQTAALGEAIAISQSLFNPLSNPTRKADAVWPERYPERWGKRTAEAIASGLTYGTLAIVQDYLTDWWQQFPDGQAVWTGGDAALLHHLMQQKTPEIASRVQVDLNLMFWGMQAYRKERICES
jgi:type III pantothenate kinase